MATLTGNTIASTYTGLLSVTGAVGADSVEAVTDGAGTSTSLSLSRWLAVKMCACLVVRDEVNKL